MRHSKVEISFEAIQALPVGGRLYDRRCNGLGVRKNAKGAAWFFRWRAGGRLRELSLGGCDSTTFTDALRKARGHRAAIDAGRDPIDERLARDEALREARELKATEAAKLAARLTLNDFAPIYARLVTKRDTSRQSDASIYWLHLGPALGHRAVEDITAFDVRRLHDSVSVTAPTRANRVYALIAHMLVVAANRGYREAPLPRKAVQKNPEQARERFLSPAEHKRLWSVLSDMTSGALSDSAQAIQLLAVTGCRKSEIVTLRWEEVDTEDRCLRLATSKTGKRTVPLGDVALAIIEARRAAKRSAWVFPNESYTGPRGSIEVGWRAARESARLDGVRLHDLRHSFASAGIAAGLSLPEIGRLLGHKAAATTQRYAHVADEVARAAADKVGARLADIVGDLRAVVG